ncbi:EI24 domain-containing protein [Amylibacter marinus]|uniref:EI24 domain-containing protein n=1 Tax=Amylibacter marinus TaxID=1475483 RepID=UPI0024E11625|nr:EI24 domain-containing protein [Amylibacter marinus]
MLTDFTKALLQIADRRFLRVLLTGVGLTIALLAALTLGVQFLLPDSISLPWIGEIEWLGAVLSGVLLLSMLVGSIFLMVPVASLFTGLFLDQIADAVEQKHYPHLPDSPRASLRVSMAEALRFFGLLVLINLLALVVYLLFTVLGPVLFWAVNGFLLGREYFQLVALRFIPAADALALRRKHGLQIFIAGFLMAVPLSIPLINLLIPVLGVATFTHIFHRLNGSNIPR